MLIFDTHIYYIDMLNDRTWIALIFNIDNPHHVNKYEYNLLLNNAYPSNSDQGVTLKFVLIHALFAKILNDQTN